MQTLHYANIIYIFIGIVAFAGIYLSRKYGEGDSSFFSGGGSKFWIMSALSIFAGSLFQFWILLLPIISLSLSSLLIMLSLIVSILMPILLVKSKYNLFDQFMKILSARLKAVLFTIVIIFFAVIQPFALLYLGESIISQFFGGSYHFLLVYVIAAAGLFTLIGGKKVVVYANAMFGAAVIASMLEVMYLGKSVSAPLTFLQILFSEGTTYFQHHNVIETNWVIGFIGFTVITWWMWWIDNSAIHFQGKQNEDRNSKAAMFATFPLIVIALVVLPMQSRSEITSLAVSSSSAGFVNNELISYFFVIGFVSVMVSAFSSSFQTIASVTIEQFFPDQVQKHVEEKHVLIARLVIVLSALLCILYIPFAQYFGVVTLVVYVQYLACFATSMVGALGMFIVWKKIMKTGISTGIIGGMSAGVIILVLTYSESGILTPILSTPYGAATGIFVFSIVCSIIGSMIHVQKFSESSVPS